jgi:hypothetical protein
MGKFKIGDLVESKKQSMGVNMVGRKGVIKDESETGAYFVDFGCGDKYYQKPNALELVETKLSDGEIFRIAAKVAEILAKKPEPKEPEKPKTKYKVGDEVVIRKDLKCGVGYKMRGRQCGTYICSRMLEFCGKTAIITHACDDHYRLQGEGWWWADEMFAGLASEMPKMARLDKVFPMPDKCIHCPIDCKSVSLSEHWIKEYGGCICRPDDCPLVEVE